MQIDYLIKYPSTICIDINDDLHQRAVIRSEFMSFLNDVGDIGVMRRVSGKSFEYKVGLNECEIDEIIFSKVSDLGECSDSFIYIFSGSSRENEERIAYEASLTGLFTRKDISALSGKFNVKFLCRDNDSLGILVFNP